MENKDNFLENFQNLSINSNETPKFERKILNFDDEIEKHQEALKLFKIISFFEQNPKTFRNDLKQMLKQRIIIDSSSKPVFYFKRVGKNDVIRIPLKEFSKKKEETKELKTCFQEISNNKFFSCSASAGILFRCKDKFFVFVSNNDPLYLFQIPGGKREFFEETSISIAKREFIEETYYSMNSKIRYLILLQDIFQNSQNSIKCAWIAEAKYHLFIIDIKSKSLLSPGVHNEGETMWIRISKKEKHLPSFSPVLRAAIKNSLIF